MEEREPAIEEGEDDDAPEWGMLTLEDAVEEESELDEQATWR